MIDAHAPTYDVSTSHVVAVDAEPATVVAGLDQLQLAQPVVEALELLGASTRLALAPSPLGKATGRERVYGLAWRVDGAAEPVPAQQLAGFSAPGYIKVIWDVRVDGHADTGTYVSTTTRFVATDETARERLRASWRVLGPVSADLARRALASVKRTGERLGEPVTYGAVAGFPAPGPRTALARVA
jgi:hypothetical protein